MAATIRKTATGKFQIHFYNRKKQVAICTLDTEELAEEKANEVEIAFYSKEENKQYLPQGVYIKGKRFVLVVTTSTITKGQHQAQIASSKRLKDIIMAKKLVLMSLIY